MDTNSTKNKIIHVMLIPSWYVNQYKPLSGIFFKEQAEALANSELIVGVLSVQTISLINIFKQFRFSFSLSASNMNGVNVCSIQIPSLPKIKPLKSIITFLFGRYLFKLYRNKFGLPDIVHLHSYDHGELALWLKHNFKIPYVVSEHSSAFFRNLLSNREITKASHVFDESSLNFAVSNAFGKQLTRLLNHNFDILPNFIDTNFFIPGHHKADNFQFLSIGFLDSNKNHKMLIEAFCSVFKHIDNVCLVIAGDGPLFHDLSELIKYHDMTDKIKMYGMAAREQVLELMQSSHCFVLPSIFETFGIVVIEAMSCGLPVISTRCGGPEDIIVSDDHGLLCEINKDSLSSAMLRIISNYDNYDPSKIRGYIEKMFSATSVVSHIKNIYSSIIEQTRNQHTEDNR